METQSHMLRWKPNSSERQRKHPVDLPTPPTPQKEKALFPLHGVLKTLQLKGCSHPFLFFVFTPCQLVACSTSSRLTLFSSWSKGECTVFSVNYTVLGLSVWSNTLQLYSYTPSGIAGSQCCPFPNMFKLSWLWRSVTAVQKPVLTVSMLIILKSEYVNILFVIVDYPSLLPTFVMNWLFKNNFSVFFLYSRYRFKIEYVWSHVNIFCISSFLYCPVLRNHPSGIDVPCGYPVNPVPFTKRLHCRGFRDLQKHESQQVRHTSGPNSASIACHCSCTSPWHRFPPGCASQFWSFTASGRLDLVVLSASVGNTSSTLLTCGLYYLMPNSQISTELCKSLQQSRYPGRAVRLIPG